jgi:hypothetical protein
MKNREESIKDIEKGLKYKLGMFFLILMLISPAFTLLIPFLMLPESMTLSLQGFFLIGGPEIFMLVGVALAGKQGLTVIKNTLKKLMGLPSGEYAASERQYRLGLSCVFIGMLIPFIMSYLPVLIDAGFIIEKDLAINLIGDMIFIAGVLIAGEQFTDKLKSLFTWDRWEIGK